MKLVAMVLVLAACGKDAPPPPRNELEVFEQELAKLPRAPYAQKQFRAVFVGPSGVFVDRKRVARLDELETQHDALVAAIAENAKLVTTLGSWPLVVLDLEAEPAKVAVEVLRLFTSARTMFEHRVRPELVSLCETQVRIGRETEEEMVALSVLIDTERTWVGLSRVGEFQQVPVRADKHQDLAQLVAVLKAHKATAFFEDRQDIELGAQAGTSGDVLRAFGALCDAGFTDIAVLPPDELSAPPRL